MRLCSQAKANIICILMILAILIATSAVLTHDSEGIVVKCENHELFFFIQNETLCIKKTTQKRGIVYQNNTKNEDFCI